jgi:hypothetical protein
MTTLRPAPGTVEGVPSDSPFYEALAGKLQEANFLQWRHLAAVVEPVAYNYHLSFEQALAYGLLIGLGELYQPAKPEKGSDLYMLEYLDLVRIDECNGYWVRPLPHVDQHVIDSFVDGAMAEGADVILRSSHSVAGVWLRDGQDIPCLALYHNPEHLYWVCLQANGSVLQYTAGEVV